MSNTIFYFIISILVVAIFITLQFNDKWDWLLFGLIYGLSMAILVAIGEYVTSRTKYPDIDSKDRYRFGI